MSWIWIVVIILIYLLGGVIAWNKMKSWSQPWYEKAWFAVIWPLMLILYGIHCLHNL